MNAFDVVADLCRHVPARGVNQYADPALAALVAGHLAKYTATGAPLFVGESPATSTQAVAFTDDSRTSRTFRLAVGGAKVARWNAYPFWLPKGEKPRVSELRTGAEYVRQVHDVVLPDHVYAVGRVAEQACGLVGIECEYLPHPGQDKAPLFVRRVDEIMRGGP